MPKRSLQERLAEQNAITEKAQSRLDAIEHQQAKRIQKIANTVGFFEHTLPDSVIEKALIQAIEDAAQSENESEAVSEKQRRETRSLQQNRARLERAMRDLRRLSNESRRRDASEKWQLGNLLALANLETMPLGDVDKALDKIKSELSDPARQKIWKRRGWECLEKQKKGLAKNDSGYSASNDSSPDKTTAHRKITLGGLVKKHELESLSPALLLGALLDKTTD